MGSMAATEKKFSKSCTIKSEQVELLFLKGSHLNLSSKYYKIKSMHHCITPLRSDICLNYTFGSDKEVPRKEMSNAMNVEYQISRVADVNRWRRLAHALPVQKRCGLSPTSTGHSDLLRFCL